MLNPKNGQVIVNKNLDSGERAASYIEAFGEETDLDMIEIYVSREPMTDNESSCIAAQPFMKDIQPHSLNYKFPLYFVAGHAIASTGVSLTTKQRDIILDSSSHNASYVQLVNEKATGVELFNTIKGIVVQGKPLNPCLLIGVYPSNVNSPAGSILKVNSNLFSFDHVSGLYHIDNNYTKNEQTYMGFLKNKTEKKKTDTDTPKITVVEESTDFSNIVTDPVLPPYQKDDILQISFLSYNTAQPFCQLFEVTYVCPAGKNVMLRKAFGFPVDVSQKQFSELEDKYIDIFTGKLV
jgi:hypothetical protein